MGLSDLFSSGGSEAKSNSGFVEGWDKNIASFSSLDRLLGLSTAAEDMLRNQSTPKFTMSERFPGLFKEQEGFANAFTNNLFSKASGTTAARGQLNPANFSNVVGSALTNAAPTLMPLISQNLQNAMIIPQQIRSQRFQDAMSPLQALVSGLGSSASSQTAGPGLGYVGAGSFLKSFGEGLGKAASGGSDGSGGLSGMFGKLF